MDFGRAFGFVFDDEEWPTKILIAGAILLGGILFFWLLLIPLILAIALLIGYSFQVTRRVIHGDPQPLPAWDNWGDLIADGLKVIVIVIVYALPLIVISACLGVPTAILRDSQSAVRVFGVLFGAAVGLIDFLWIIAMSLLLPAAIGLYADEDDLGAAFRFGDVVALVRGHFGTYLLTLVMSWVANFAGGLGAIFCGIGLFVTRPYGFVVTGHVYGQAYLVARGGAQEPVAAELEEIS
jgi:hypothetical protein